MPNIRALHHVHVQVTDLEANRRFVEAFGLRDAGRVGERHHFRTGGRDAYSLVVQPGADTSLLGLAFEVDRREDLLQAVRDFGAEPPRALNAPGGGEAVTLRDPEGLAIHLVHGIEGHAPAALPEPMHINYPGRMVRLNAGHQRRAVGPAQLLRLGHVGLFIRSFDTVAWYEQVLGLRCSERFHAGTPDHPVGGFWRLDRGAEHVDHHTVGFFAFGKTALHHLSFEVFDIEQQMFAHRHLQRQGYELVWGVGRHPLGSHVFDTWKDPNGLRFETYSDTDLCNDQRAPLHHDIAGSEMDLWSNDSAERYFA
jgi:catechol 2,3-dioxygenase-like lactoylglutathione lyase family enzyme